jgi:hypothetical protein
MKFFAFLFTTSIVTVLVSSPAKADDPSPRGHRVVAELNADIDKDGTPDLLVIAEHPEDDGNLRLRLQASHTSMIVNDHLIGAIARDEEDLTSYGVSIKQNAAGSVVVTATKDWGTSMWSNDYTIAFRKGAYVVAGYDYEFSYREQHGKCSLNLLTGAAIVNGHKRTFKIPETSLAKADGIELLKLCNSLGAK